MYSEADLQSAIAAGALSSEAAEALRLHVLGKQAPTVADEEHFRLISGFNDIFVTIACALVIFAAAAIGGQLASWVSGLFVGAACWAMAEFFTRKRRMALPSIVLLLGFTIGLGVAAGSLIGVFLPEHAVSQSYTGPNGITENWQNFERYPWQQALMLAAGGLVAAIGAALHWRRFQVAITIAAGIAACVALVLALLAAALGRSPATQAILTPAAFVCGLVTFAFAMWWDVRDPTRTTLRADIAFWLHLLAAPLIAHPLFYWMGALRGHDIGAATAVGVLAIYLVFAVVALAVDRRALLVSALAYVLTALGSLMRTFGSVELSFALTALVIGAALLLLSAWWAPMRRALISRLPANLATRLPQGVSLRST